MNMLKYKDFEGSIEPSVEDRCLHGKLLFVNDLVTYQGRDIDELEQSFREAVDDYVAFCAEMGREPEKPFKGVFQVRVTPEVHKTLVMRAQRDNIKLNDLVGRAIDAFLAEACVEHTHHHHHHHDVVMKHDRVTKWEVFRASQENRSILHMAMIDEGATADDDLEATPPWKMSVLQRRDLS